LYCQDSSFHASITGISVMSPRPEALSLRRITPAGVLTLALTSIDT
jgi:hypothetical protein